MSLEIEAAAEASLVETVAFLSDAAYPERRGPVARRETHMSWVFFVDGAVYKLKKPVRLPYLDFSTLARREAACRAEFRLNQALARDVYLGVTPVTRDAGRLQLGGGGRIVDWLVRMRRLDERLTLESRLRVGAVTTSELAALSERLVRFYRTTPRVNRTGAAALAGWRQAVAYNRAVLLNPALGMPSAAVRAVFAAQARFLRNRGRLVAERARRRRILDAHGDLRPEHIWLGPPIRIIDRLEFSPALRAVDPLDEIAFLDLETEFLGRPDVGRRIRQDVTRALGERTAPELYLFYRSARAALRARLAIAHLLEPDPRTPEKWPRQARAYLAIALRDAQRLEAALNRPGGR
jgi:aminoglycoside phosphotransferase family enzyme